MKLNQPIRTWFENSVGSSLRDIVLSDASQFSSVDSPELADIIIFENDKPDYIRQTTDYKLYPEKCIVISEADEPTYFLPACYASNQRGWLSYKRSQTIPYFISQRLTPNQFINDFTSVTPQRYLYSFRGGSTSWVRKKLFKLKNDSIDVRIEEANHYHHWNYEETYTNQKTLLQKQYADLIKESSFFLCPRGVGVSSIRLFEVMQAGRVPVIIADNWIPVANIPWDKFSLRVSEKDLANLDHIIRSHQGDTQNFGLNARQAWIKYCSPDVQAKFLADAILTIQHNRNHRREQFLHFVFPLFELAYHLKVKVRTYLKYLILRAFSLMGREFPYSLNRPMEEQMRKMRP